MRRGESPVLTYLLLATAYALAFGGWARRHHAARWGHWGWAPLGLVGAAALVLWLVGRL
jgi:hypothetical protein